jgi:2,3-bisphosphoglycerate-dependent phosphoglycerate mutase
MAAAISQHGLVVSSRSHHWDAKDSRFQKRMGNVRLVSTGICCSGSRKARLVCASGTPSSVMQPVQLPSDGDRGQSPKKSSNFSQFPLYVISMIGSLVVCFLSI